MMETLSTEALYEYFLRSSGVATDTRKLRENNIFFALKGENFNGNKFAMKAIEEGCSFAVVDEPAGDDPRLLRVADALTALQDLAKYHRRKLGTRMIALTGSNGKTTSKELLHAALSARFKTLATEGNLNNHIGVPLTLLKLNKDHQRAVIEMGANHRGEIRFLSELAEPDSGLITNIGKAHLEGFGGEEGVKLGKGELFDFLKKKNGKVFVHSDSPVLMEMSAGMTRITYGTSGSDVVGTIAEEFPFISVAWQFQSESYITPTRLTGSYNLPNILCAIAVALHEGVPGEEISQAISEYQPSNNRSQIVKSGQLQIILDSYNANPDSMKVAIENLAGMPGAPKFAFLGDMRELGEVTEKEHQEIIELLQKRNINQGALVGPVFSSLKGSLPSFENVNECIRKMIPELPESGIILIKGSRGTRMDAFADAILAREKAS